MKKRRRRKPTAAVWIWEFSKKVIRVVTILYVISFVYSIVATFYFISVSATYATCLDTLITETNETFRYIVGGYLIKAGIENVTKIATKKKEDQPEDEDVCG